MQKTKVGRIPFSLQHVRNYSICKKHIKSMQGPQAQISHPPRKQLFVKGERSKVLQALWKWWVALTLL